MGQPNSSLRKDRNRSTPQPEKAATSVQVHFRLYHHKGPDEVLLQGRNVDQNAITNEDKIRNFLPVAYYPTPGSVPATIDYLYPVVATEGPFEGIMGLSEGYSVAATFLAEDIRRCEFEGKKIMFKATAFLCGSPPLSGDGKILASGGRV